MDRIGGAARPRGVWRAEGKVGISGYRGGGVRDYKHLDAFRRFWTKRSERKRGNDMPFCRVIHCFFFFFLDFACAHAGMSPYL